jgi:hypothetical protein
MAQEDGMIPAKIRELHEHLAKSHPALERGMVWCERCLGRQLVDSADALRHGSPRCCGYTMTLGSPDDARRN